MIVEAKLVEARRLEARQLEARVLETRPRARVSRTRVPLAAAAAIAAVLMTAPATEALQSGISFRFDDSETHVFTDEERAVIEEIGEAAIVEIARLIDAPASVEVVVQTGPQVIPETGEGGAATAPGQVAWTVDPSREGGVVAIAREHLRTTLFHEVHHLVRGWTFADGTAGTRMIDAVVAEGLATAFERDAGGWSPPWGDYSGVDIDAWVDELIEIPHLGAYMTWMFQHPDGRRWIGYRSGTYLADRAKEGCGCSAADLVATPTDEVLRLGGR